MGATLYKKNPLYLLGSTAAHVVKHAPATTLILRESGKAKDAPLTVLVAVDGSPASLNALRKIASQIQSLPEKVLVSILHVVSIVGIWQFIAPVEFIASIEDNLNMAAQTILAEADKVLSEFKISPVDMIVRSGEPAGEIIKAAKDIEADLIIVGAQGRSAVEHFFLGSVSHKLSMHAPCSTVVVK
jgi:nucleotide-binding universal stress UspA family protein